MSIPGNQDQMPIFVVLVSWNENGLQCSNYNEIVFSEMFHVGSQINELIMLQVVSLWEANIILQTCSMTCLLNNLHGPTAVIVL